MKRKDNLYQDIYDINNIIEVFNEVCRNTKIKGKYTDVKSIKVYMFHEFMRF